MKRVLFLLLLVLIPVAYAADTFDTSYKAKVESINASESAFYTFTINNYYEKQDRFQLYTLSAFWDITPTLIYVDSNDSVSFTLEVNLLDDRIDGPQLVPITIKSLSTSGINEENIYVFVTPSNATKKNYVPNIAMDVKMKDQLDPRDPLAIEVYMRNRNPLDIKDLRIVIESPLFDKEYVTSLTPLGEKTNEILFKDVSPMQTPGIYAVNVKLIVDNKTVAQSQKEINIVPYSEVQVKEAVVKSLFSRSQIIELTNDGNSKAVKKISVPKNFFERIFTSTSANYEKSKEFGVTYLTWNIPLEPQQSYELKVKTDYTILGLIALVIILAIVAYYILRSPLMLYKRAKIVESSEHGITEIRVKLHVKNRSGKTVRGIKVIDRYPKIASLQEDDSVGVMKPTKMISADKSHSVLLWNIDVLEPYEERLITYRLKSSLNIVGNMQLQSGKVKFQSKAGERTYRSNGVTLLHKSEDLIKYE